MPEFYSVSHKVKKNLLMGTKISDALKENISKSTYYQLLIAEQHGEMEKSIKQLGSLLERRVEQQNKLKSLMVYPMIRSEERRVGKECRAWWTVGERQKKRKQ